MDIFRPPISGYCLMAKIKAEQGITPFGLGVFQRHVEFPTTKDSLPTKLVQNLPVRRTGLTHPRHQFTQRPQLRGIDGASPTPRTKRRLTSTETHNTLLTNGLVNHERRNTNRTESISISNGAIAAHGRMQATRPHHDISAGSRCSPKM